MDRNLFSSNPNSNGYNNIWTRKLSRPAMILWVCLLLSFALAAPYRAIRSQDHEFLLRSYPGTGIQLSTPEKQAAADQRNEDWRAMKKLRAEIFAIPFVVALLFSTALLFRSGQRTVGLIGLIACAALVAFEFKIYGLFPSVESMR